MFRVYRGEEGLKKMDRYLFGRLGKLEEFVYVILFLSSNEASYLTGEVLVIGGYC